MTIALPLQGSGLLPEPPDVRAQLSARARRTRVVNRASFALPLVGGALGAWLLTRGARRRPAGLAALAAAFGFGVVRWQLQRFVTENVPFEVVATLGDIEVRRYPEQVWAETVIEGGGWSDALSQGFERLAGYLFGGNNEALRLSMTAPALSSYADTDRDGGEPDHGAAQPASGETGLLQRTISFVMPADRDLDSLPAPQDTSVRLRALPERLVAALHFRGDYRSSLPGDKRDELLRRLREAGIRTLGEARFAGYDPPTTWPPLRRNEVLIDLASG